MNIAVVIVGLIAIGLVWELWRSFIEPLWRLSRMYGWRKGWRFYRFLDREVGKESDWDPDLQGPGATIELRKRLPKRRH